MSRLLVGMMIAFALVAAGCGGDDEVGGGGGGADSGAWKAEVNKICQENQAEVQKIAQDVAGSGISDPAKAAAEVIEKTSGTQEELLERMREVDVPGDVEEDYTAFLDRLDDTLPLFQDLADVLRDGKEDPELTTKLTEIASDTRPFATDNGLDECLTDAAGS